MQRQNNIQFLAESFIESKSSKCFKNLYERLKPGITNHCYLILKSQELAQDVDKRVARGAPPVADLALRSEPLPRDCDRARSAVIDARPAARELLQVQPARVLAEQPVLRLRCRLGQPRVAEAHPDAEQGEELVPRCLRAPRQLRGPRRQHALERGRRCLHACRLG